MTWDGALLLADTILLITNGSKAWIVEVVENTLAPGLSRINPHQ
jgi:hypothetical protein